MKNQVSIAIAGYNCQATITSVLDSYKAALENLVVDLDTEIIYVDDASSDDSCMLVQEYAKENPKLNIRVIKHITNQSCARTRKTATLYARYDYICFMDSDDYVMDNFYNVIANQQQDYDIFFLQTYHTPNPLEHQKYDDKKYQQNLLDKETMIISVCWVTHKVWRRAMFDDIKYGFRLNIYEDWSYTKVLIPRYRSNIKVADQVTTIYNTGSESMTRHGKISPAPSVFKPYEQDWTKGTLALFKVYVSVWENNKFDEILVKSSFEDIMKHFEKNLPMMSPRKMRKCFKLWNIPWRYFDLKQLRSYDFSLWNHYRAMAYNLRVRHWNELISKQETQSKK